MQQGKSRRESQMPADTAVAIPELQKASPSSHRRRAPYGHKQGKEKGPVKRIGRAEYTDGWFPCFIACELLARRQGPYTPDQRLLPSGARIFYYTTLALERQELPGSTNRSHDMLSWEMTDAFLVTALKVAAGLECSYASAVRLRRTPLNEGARLLSVYDGHCGASDPQQAPNEMPLLCGIAAAPSTHPLVAHEPLLGTLVGQFLAERLPISPVANSQYPMPVALRLLKAQLAQEAARMRQVPSGEVYLYEEPLHIWLGRLVQAHRWMGTVLRGRQK